jgi:hypothetical protein
MLAHTSGSKIRSLLTFAKSRGGAWKNSLREEVLLTNSARCRQATTLGDSEWFLQIFNSEPEFFSGH